MQPPASPTAPGPPVKSVPRPSPLSAAVSSKLNDNPFNVDLVIPYDISLSKKDLKDRPKALEEIKLGYEALLRALEGEGGLKVATRGGRGGKGQEEVWVFVGATDNKVQELVDREREQDTSHNLPPSSSFPPSPATRLRLLHSLLTAPAIQGGLGITPAGGAWTRVKSITALHDEASDKAWIEKWTVGGDWQVGLTRGLPDDKAGGMGDHQPPPVHLYFEFLTTYTLSLAPLSAISVLFYLLTPSDSYPPLYAFILSVYATTFIALWRIKERKLAVRWGTTGCESVAVGRLRPEYIANMGLDKRDDLGGEAIDAMQAGNELKRDTRVAVSVPVIVACGVGLGVVLMGIFVLEAFVGQVYDGVGKEIVPLIPTVLFSLIVPQIIGAYQTLAKAMVKWEDHPTPVGEGKSLTAKTFAMNAIVAYLGLFLSAYIYVPFGSFIMAHVQHRLSGKNVHVKGSAGATTSGGAGQQAINGGRLKSQLFAYTVTNQVINAFLELGMPYVMRFVQDWRAGKTTIKNALKKREPSESEKVPSTEEEVEKRFLDKVERELALPEYTLFTDYAEMVTQFGYVTIWSIVWPLAPVFALLNNYVELRSDALKICEHVRRPVGDRVETIGSWLETLGMISWIGAVTNATLIYLFRPSPPSPDLAIQSSNPNFTTPGSGHLASIVSSYQATASVRGVLPALLPLALVALAASHGFIVLRWVVEGVVERVWWRGSEEERQLGMMRAGGVGAAGAGGQGRVSEKKYSLGSVDALRDGFWNGGEEGAREIGRAIKAE